MKKVIILASGAGSNARKIAEYFRASDSVSIELIACNKKDAGVWNVAKEFEIDEFLITRDNFSDSEGLIKKMSELEPDLIVLAGFLWKIPDAIIKKFDGKIINLHPALLPKFGGKGMYGSRVHEAVFNQKEKYTGITIHYVNENYDEGHIIFQKIVELEANEPVSKIEKKIHKLEHENFPLVIDFLLRNDH